MLLNTNIGTLSHPGIECFILPIILASDSGHAGVILNLFRLLIFGKFSRLRLVDPRSVLNILSKCSNTLHGLDSTSNTELDSFSFLNEYLYGTLCLRLFTALLNASFLSFSRVRMMFSCFETTSLYAVWMSSIDALVIYFLLFLLIFLEHFAL